MIKTSPFLELDKLAALANMRFSTRQRIEGPYSGRHTSRQHGGSGEFADYREYTPGEDLRRLDWRVLARTGRAYVKLYQEETNLSCMMLLDASGSMQFGGGGSAGGAGSKLAYAQYLTTALSHLISEGRDQVGLAVASAALDEYLPPGSTANQMRRLQEIIAEVRTKPETQLAPALHELYTRIQQRGVLLLVSDFLVDPLDEVFAALRLFRHRQWEVIALHLIHPDEERLPQGVAYRFEGLEDDGVVNCSPAEIRAAYETRFAEHLSAVRNLALATGCVYRRVSTAVPYTQTLGGFLVERTG
jgi:uncharacterized protein (DUF58 family)